MNFNINSPILFVLAAIVILFVLAQSVFFLVRAWKQGKKLGMKSEILKKTVSRAAIFTVAPAVSIFIGVVTLATKLGVPLPWLRLSVIGSLPYELTAAQQGATAVGASLSDAAALNPTQYVTIALLMSIGCLLPLILVALITKKIEGGMLKLEKRDKRWGDIFITSLFMGVISAFLGVIFCDVVGHGVKGWIPVFVMLISAAAMLLCGLLQKLTKWRWINDYALPFSMIIGMICAVPITNAVI